MGIWSGSGELARNPYHYNAFRVARVSREVVRSALVAQIVHETQQEVDAGVHSIGGTPVTAEELNDAQQLLGTASGRLTAELLEHANERLPLDGLRELLREAAAQAPEAADLPRPDVWALECIRRFLSEIERPDACFGATELEIVPPFGESRGD